MTAPTFCKKYTSCDDADLTCHDSYFGDDKDCYENPEYPQTEQAEASSLSDLLAGLQAAQRDIEDIVNADEYLHRCKDCKRIKHTRFICPHCGSRQ